MSESLGGSRRNNNNASKNLGTPASWFTPGRRGDLAMLFAHTCAASWVHITAHVALSSPRCCGPDACNIDMAPPFCTAGMTATHAAMGGSRMGGSKVGGMPMSARGAGGGSQSPGMGMSKRPVGRPLSAPRERGMGATADARVSTHTYTYTGTHTYAHTHAHASTHTHTINTHALTHNIYTQTNPRQHAHIPHNLKGALTACAAHMQGPCAWPLTL